MTDFKEKLETAHFNYCNIVKKISFKQWCLMQMEVDHKQLVKQSGEIGEAFSKIGDIEREKRKLVVANAELIIANAEVADLNSDLNMKLNEPCNHCGV